MCCKDGEKGECKPAKDIPSMEKEISLKVFPGAPCDDFNGTCNEQSKCVLWEKHEGWLINNATAVHSFLLNILTC